MKKTKILFILTKAEHGGAETQLIYLINSLDRKKYSIFLMLLSGEGELIKEFESIKNIELIKYNKKEGIDLLIFLKIARFIRKEKIDIIQTFLANQYAYIPSFLAMRGSVICGIRATTNPTDYTWIEYSTRYRFVRILSRFKKIILVANSQVGKKIYEKEGLKKEMIEVIYNGIESDKFSGGNKQKIIDEFKLKDKIVLTMVSRLVPGKNQEELIRLMPEIKKKHDNIILIIVGDGPQEKELKRMAEKLKVSKSVIFTGNRKDVPDILAATDIFLFPTKFPEGWPNCVGEAMAAGLPVIAYPKGDLKKIIKDKHNGILLRPNSKNLLKEIVNLTSNKKKREELGMNAKSTIRNKYSVENMVESYERLYESMIN